MWVRHDKCGSLLTNTGDLAYMGEPLIIVTSRCQTSSVLTIMAIWINKVYVYSKTKFKMCF